VKWYFTPDIGTYGGAVEIDEQGNCCRVAFAMLTPDGGMGLVKWIPSLDGMCKPKSYQVSNMTLYEVDEVGTSKLKGMFGNVIVPVNGKGPRLAL